MKIQKQSTTGIYFLLSCFSVFLLFLTACATPTPDAADLTEQQRERNQGYALLHGLVQDQANVDKIFFVKKAPAPTTDLVRRIGDASRQAVARLQEFAGQDKTLLFDDEGLPKAERGIRDDMRSATAKRLLFSGDTFERELLLTQVNSLEYGSHLAAWVARNESDADDRAAWLSEFSTTYQKLWQECVEHLTVTPVETKTEQ